MIVKVQRAIAPANGDWLMYDKDQKYRGQIPDKEIPNSLRLMMGKDYKAYFQGDYLKGNFVLARRVGDQPW